MDPRVHQEIQTAVEAIDDALTGLVGFLMPLKPTLRNEILQLCGHHMDRTRDARDRLKSLLGQVVGPDAG